MPMSFRYALLAWVAIPAVIVACGQPASPAAPNIEATALAELQASLADQGTPTATPDIQATIDGAAEALKSV